MGYVLDIKKERHTRGMRAIINKDRKDRPITIIV